MRTNRVKRAAFGLLAAILAAGTFPVGQAASAETKGGAASASGASTAALLSYSAWLSAQAEEKADGEALTLTAAAASRRAETVEGREAVLSPADGAVEWTFTLPRGGLYTLTVRYAAVSSAAGFTGAAERTLLVNGEIPYQEAQYVSFARRYADESGFLQDAAGNDIRPAQRELMEFSAYTVRDASGYQPQPLLFLFSAGENRLTMQGVRGELYIESITLSAPQTLPTYAEYTAALAGAADETAGAEEIVLRAELPSRRSAFTLTAASDRSSVNTTPCDVAAVRLNTIGGSKWSTAGQWLSWDFSVEKSGFYCLTLRARQNVHTGAVSARRVLLDGEVPFAEADAVSFAYSDDWKLFRLGGEETYRLWLEAGAHTLTLEAVLGDMAPVLEEVSSVLTALNSDYLRILTYTGADPDIYRNYAFDRLIPDVVADLGKQEERLSRLSGELKQSSGARGEITATLDRVTAVLEKMHRDPDTIAENFSAFKDGVSSLGTWLSTYAEQPLVLDTLWLTPASAPLPEQKESALQNFWYRFRLFVRSFFTDYSQVGISGSADATEREVTVWTVTGRDQSEIMQRLADELFTPQEGVRVRVSLVAGGTLLPNILAGTGPDVFLSASAGEPVNYAIRDAVCDLSGFADFAETAERYPAAALTPFTYKGKVYALPETVSFPVMFTRTDVFSSLGLTPPETWDDFYELIGTLQKNNLTAGVAWNTLYTLLLYQSGGSLYNDSCTASALDSDKSIRAFKKSMEFYTAYGLPVTFDFANRFRSGDMPIGIVDYTTYNTLLVFAPEIKGQWAMSPVPGMVREDGTADHTSAVTPTGSIMLRGVRDREAAWTYMKWWNSSVVQSRYGIELETVLGASAKLAASTLAAVESLPWTAREYAALKTQWGSLIGTPEIPGSYYLSRILGFAFSSVYSMGQDPVETMEEKTRELNEEFARKLREFEAH